MLKVLIEKNKFSVIDDAEATPGQSQQLIELKLALRKVKDIDDLRKLERFKFQGIICGKDNRLVAYMKFVG